MTEWMRGHRRILEGGALFFLLAAAVVLMLAFTHAWSSIKASERCFETFATSQFPKWLGCAMASHENLAGGLIAAAGALFAGWLAWSAVRDQISFDRAIAREAQDAPRRLTCHIRSDSRTDASRHLTIVLGASADGVKCEILVVSLVSHPNADLEVMATNNGLKANGIVPLRHPIALHRGAHDQQQFSIEIIDTAAATQDVTIRFEGYRCDDRRTAINVTGVAPIVRSGSRGPRS